MQTIAERKLVIKSGDIASQVTVRLGTPVQDESGLDWKCPFEVECGPHLRSMVLYGTDAMQALQLAISHLDSELEIIARLMKGDLYYLDKPFKSILQNGGLVKKAPLPRRFDFSGGKN
jgi:hypothetical protein